MPREPVAALAIDWPEAPDILRPDSARAPLLATPAEEALTPETDGENEALIPAPETNEAELEACADPVPWPVDWPVDWLGLFLEVPLEPVAAWAIDWPDAPDILRPASARALLLAKPETEALTPDIEGENKAMVLEPETVEAVLAACAEPLP